MGVSEIIRQKPYEQVKYILHRHALTFIPIILLFVVLASIPLIVYLMTKTLLPSIFEGPTVFPLTVLAASVYYLSIYLFFYGYFVDFYLDLWIVTNDRIIDMEQHGLFNRSITELDLFRIQDVTTQVKGVFPTIFHYGDVVVKTASSNTHIIFEKVPNPNKIREELIRLSDEDRKFHAGPT